MALKGVHVVELGGLAPVPYCGMILADNGADVIKVDRCSRGMAVGQPDALTRSKRSIALDLRSKEGKEVLLRLLVPSPHSTTPWADVLLDPFRPGVLERLGLDPQVLLQKNPRLIVARLTGYGQSGAYAQRAGHDINYIAIGGALAMFRGSGNQPIPPANILGDFAGGGMMCAFGITLALLERNKSGKGQVVDCAMVDSAAYLASFVFSARKGIWAKPAGENMLDGGAPFYRCYETKDNRFVAVGAIEPQFYAKLIQGLGVEKEVESGALPSQMDQDQWGVLQNRFSEVFRSRTQKDWTQVFEDIDACVTPVLSMDELETNSHTSQRGLLTSEEDGTRMPTPAPRLSKTPAAIRGARCMAGQHTADVLQELGYSGSEIQQMSKAGAIPSNTPRASL